MDFDRPPKEDQAFPCAFVQGKSIQYPAGTYKLVRIPNPGDRNIFPIDLLVIKEELDQGRIIGMSVTSWRSLATQCDCPELSAFIASLNIIRLPLLDESDDEDQAENGDVSQAVVAS